MGIIVVWVALCFVAGAIASKKGRSSVGFFFLSLVLSPLIGIIAALIAKPNEEKVEKSKIAEGNSKKCPFCAEIIKAEAKVCRYCGRELAKADEVDWIVKKYSQKEENGATEPKGKKGSGYGRFYAILCLVAIGIIIISNYKNDVEPNISKNSTKDSNCVEFVALLSANEVATEMGKTVSWVLANWRINLWEKPSESGKGRKVGEMYVGSDARLIRTSGSDYLVVSPLDKSEGWINKIQTKGIIRKNPETLKLCR